MNTKQVIVIRKDLNMRKGKMCAQASHASMAFLTKQMSCSYAFGANHPCFSSRNFTLDQSLEIKHWIENSFKKICISVNTEKELEELHQLALDKRLISHLIVDNGATEFNGIATKTCIAIGPHWDEKFIGLTDHLPLL